MNQLFPVIVGKAKILTQRKLSRRYNHPSNVREMLEKKGNQH